MNYITELSEIGFSKVIIYIFLLLAAIKFAWDLVFWFADKLGLKTKSQIKKEEDEKMLLQHNEDICGIKDDIKKNNDAMVSIIRNEIVNSCKAFQDSGVTRISALDYENLEGLFDNYKALGGNHLITKLEKWFKTLDVDLDTKDV